MGRPKSEKTLSNTERKRKLYKQISRKKLYETVPTEAKGKVITRPEQKKKSMMRRKNPQRLYHLLQPIE